MSAARELSLTGECALSVPDNAAEPTERSATQRGLVDEGSSPAIRRRLPDERRALTHHFSIAGQEGYLTVGVYEDGLPGEIFITMSKQGSTISAHGLIRDGGFAGTAIRGTPRSALQQVHTCTL